MYLQIGSQAEENHQLGKSLHDQAGEYLQAFT